MEIFNSANEYFKRRFGAKAYKIALDGGMSCPNRNKENKGGCIFCSEGGSGDFAEKNYGDINEQIERAILRVIDKKPKKFIAYFQSYTNTYAPIEYLKSVFYPAVTHSKICALSIATRPDCLDGEVVRLLENLNKIKPVFIELGLQTTNDTTAKKINRGYKTEVYFDAVKRLKAVGLSVITHVIIGLPDEDENDLLNTVDAVNKSGCDGVKLQLLHILQNTVLNKIYEEGKYLPLEKEQYFKLLSLCIRSLKPEIVIHRITGDAPKKILVEPKWSADKKKVLNELNKYFKENGVRQGDLYKL
ncbi:MAG: TIGR01212 family radical SAM protein [Clostridiales bacterium]|nr:TIGR01212 family radical SAM protein [Clostridiales bacterium]